MVQQSHHLSPESGDNLVKFFLECLFHVRMIKERADCTFFVHCGGLYFCTKYSVLKISTCIWSYISRCYEKIHAVVETFYNDTLRLTKKMMIIHIGC